MLVSSLVIVPRSALVSITLDELESFVILPVASIPKLYPLFLPLCFSLIVPSVLICCCSYSMSSSAQVFVVQVSTDAHACICFPTADTDADADACLCSLAYVPAFPRQRG